MSNISNRSRYNSKQARSGRLTFVGVLLVILVAIGGANLWEINRGKSGSSQVAVVQPKADPSVASQDDVTRHAVATLRQVVAALQQSEDAFRQTVKDLRSANQDLRSANQDLRSANQSAADQISDLQRQVSADQDERKLLSEQLSTLTARVDGLVNTQATAPAQNRHRGRTASASREGVAFGGAIR